MRLVFALLFMTFSFAVSAKDKSSVICGSGSTVENARKDLNTKLESQTTQKISAPIIYEEKDHYNMCVTASAN